MVKYYLSVLEACDWKWTITEIDQQPEGLLKDVLFMKGMLGQVAGQLRLKRQRAERQNAKKHNRN